MSVLAIACVVAAATHAARSAASPALDERPLAPQSEAIAPSSEDERSAPAARDDDGAAHASRDDPTATAPRRQLAWAAALPTDADVTAAIDGAIAWLLEHQQESGAWGSHHSSRPIEVLCSVPGSHDAFRVATTALCVMALSDAERLAGRGDERTRAAIERGIDHVLAGWDVKRMSGMEHYTVWALGYALRAASEQLLHRPDAAREERLRATCAELVEKLALYQSLDGGWGYLSLDDVPTFRPSWTSMSFTTATCLMGLVRAREAGIEVPDAVIVKAAASLERCRTPKGVFTYGEIWNRSPVAGINVEAGAACRTPACLLALAGAGRDVADAPVRRALDDLLVRQARFQVLGLRRPIPHESWYSISGYFYLYGHAYAAWLIEDEAPALRERYGKELARAIFVCRQPDGSFWDYPLYSYHKPYGTAYALLGLLRVAPGAAAD